MRNLYGKRYLVPIAALGLILSSSGIAGANHPGDGATEQQERGRHSVHDGVVDTPLEEHEAHGHDQHGTLEGHISPTQLNLDVVGTWRGPRTRNHTGRVTDVWSLG